MRTSPGNKWFLLPLGSKAISVRAAQGMGFIPAPTTHNCFSAVPSSFKVSLNALLPLLKLHSLECAQRKSGMLHLSTNCFCFNGINLFLFAMSEPG